VATGDVRLAARFADGEPEAIREVYQAYGRLVYAVAYKVLCDSSLAEDATQQTFLQAWRAAASYDPTRELGPWLATIARRAAISLYRRDRRHEDINNVDPSDPRLATLPPSVEQLYDVWEVRRALQSLSSQERELIQLQHYRELSHSEIAEHLSIPIGTVKSRTYRAHRRLAGLLGHLREPDADAAAPSDVKLSDTKPVAQLPGRSGRERRDG
jgi:RNA polymerase sigma-70 factor (ECF subfamily)